MWDGGVDLLASSGHRVYGGVDPLTSSGHLEWDGGVILLASSEHLVWDGGGVLLESSGHLVWDGGVMALAISRGSALIAIRIIKVTYCMHIIVIHGVECTI